MTGKDEKRSLNGTVHGTKNGRNGFKRRRERKMERTFKTRLNVWLFLACLRRERTRQVQSTI